ncbi:MAG: HAMP domain-containing protein [Bifidobacteriaceae bacterium]|nr:HAMP domain-containing protein [Bifidobacteriaceae bacterium]
MNRSGDGSADGSGAASDNVVAPAEPGGRPTADPPSPAAPDHGRAEGRRPPSWGLTGRLVAVFALVIALTGVVAWGVAAYVGPGVFHRHLVAAGLGQDQAALTHAEQAFRSASATSLGIALVGAILAALTLSILITRRVSGTIAQLARAARRVADGRFDARVASPKLGAEFDGLAEAFNQMGAALEESQQLRDRLLGDVAHELRTPVATIGAYLEAIEDGIAQLTPETAAILRAQGERLARLASDLAAVTRAQDPLARLDLVDADVAALADAAAQAARPAFAAKGVALVVMAEPAVTVRVDRARFAQVLANLLENALRHTPTGGQVSLTAALGERAVRISVEDTGDGIAHQHLGAVFERFYRADEARDRASGGAGIGLAVAKALVEAHGGSIAAASDGPGQGATFTIDLPR